MFNIVAISLVLLLIAACDASTCQDQDAVVKAANSQLGLPFSKCIEVAAFCQLPMSASQIPLTLLDSINYDADQIAIVKAEAQKLKSQGDFTVGNLISLACPRTCNQPCTIKVEQATPPPAPGHKCTDHPKILKAMTKKMGFNQFKTCGDVAGFCQMKFDASMVPPSILDTIEYEDEEAMAHIRQAAYHYHAHGEYTVGNMIGLACPATCGTPCNPAPQIEVEGDAVKKWRYTHEEMVEGLRGIERHPALRGNKGCVFPFIFDGVEYNSCADAPIGADDGKAWCSTKVNRWGVHVGGQGKWRHCKSATPAPTESSNGNLRGVQAHPAAKAIAKKSNGYTR